MYLSLIVLPLLGSIASGFFGRKIGIMGAHVITCSCVIITTLLSFLAFIEVGFNNIPVSIQLFKWVDSETMDILWAFNFDSLTVSMLIPVLIVSSLVHLYSIEYMSHDPHNQRFFSYLSLFTFMMIILVTANNYLLMFVGWEGVGVCSYLLVSFWFTRIAANQSSLAAFLTNRVGDCLLTVGMFALLWSFGNIDYSTVFTIAPYINENIISIIGICLLIGAMAKSSQIGLHIWLPMAMEGPTPVSALIHAATMVTAGVYLLMRSSPLLEYSSTVLICCLWLGALTTVFSSLIGLFQQDIKKVIAYSTMSQLGMMVIAIGLSSYNVALFHLVNHAFYKALLFLGAGAVIHAVSDNQDFRKFGGLRHFLPLTYSVMLIASLSLVAFPFMTGFYSKDFILESAYGQFSFSGTSVYYIATTGAIFTTLYSIKVLYLTFLSNPFGPITNYNNAHEGKLYMSLPLVTLAVFSIFFGYITKDIFIGLGSNFFGDNSIFIHPGNEIMMDTEFAVPTLYKLLPLVFTILLTTVAFILSEFIPRFLLWFKFTNLGYVIFGFFNQRFLMELFYNKYIVNFIFKLGGQTTKSLDKGSVELVGPYGLEKGLSKLSKSLVIIESGFVTTYALYISICLIIYLLIPYINLNSCLLILLLISLFKSNDIKYKEVKLYTLQSNLLLDFLAAVIEYKEHYWSLDKMTGDGPMDHKVIKSIKKDTTGFNDTVYFSGRGESSTKPDNSTNLGSSTNVTSYPETGGPSNRPTDNRSNSGNIMNINRVVNNVMDISSLVNGSDNSNNTTEVNNQSNNNENSTARVNNQSNNNEARRVEASYPSNSNISPRVVVDNQSNNNENGRAEVNNQSNNEDVQIVRVNNRSNSEDVQIVRVNNRSNNEDVQIVRVNNRSNNEDVQIVRVNNNRPLVYSTSQYTTQMAEQNKKIDFINRRISSVQELANNSISKGNKRSSLDAQLEDTSVNKNKVIKYSHNSKTDVAVLKNKLLDVSTKINYKLPENLNMVITEDQKENAHRLIDRYKERHKDDSDIRKIKGARIIGTKYIDLTYKDRLNLDENLNPLSNYGASDELVEWFFKPFLSLREYGSLDKEERILYDNFNQYQFGIPFVEKEEYYNNFNSLSDRKKIIIRKLISQVFENEVVFLHERGDKLRWDASSFKNGNMSKSELEEINKVGGIHTKPHLSNSGIIIHLLTTPYDMKVPGLSREDIHFFVGNP